MNGINKSTQTANHLEHSSLCATCVDYEVGVFLGGTRQKPSSARSRIASDCFAAVTQEDQKGKNQEKKMHFRVVLLLLGISQIVPSQEWKHETSHWYPKEPKDTKICANLTQILDNWKFAILTRVKELLINDHHSVLPEYSRIAPLSNALGELHRQFDDLKRDLASLTVKFDGVEAFVDRVTERGFPQRPRQGAGLRSGQMRVLQPIRVRRRGLHRA
ncbi:uncharacterized protein LOC130931712 [Corythoichthys intestinalis]|uniref:uncharacterized protein LOC130931712 n=1 Tax=Corythoichthys intestinalis TaxID=161448 RepID=UPI0025A6560E|nr:uncharacterized protein LOC130931712 [Corythoichthys intestinalis]